MVNSNPTVQQIKSAKAAGTYFDGKVYPNVGAARDAQRNKTIAAGYARSGPVRGSAGRGRGGSRGGRAVALTRRPAVVPRSDGGQNSGGSPLASRAQSSPVVNLPSSAWAGDVSSGNIHHSRFEVKTDVVGVVRIAQLETFITKVMEDCTAFAVLEYNFSLRCFLVNGGAFSGTVTFGWWHPSLSKEPPKSVSEIMDLPGNRTLALTPEMSFRPPTWARVLWKRADNVAIEHCVPQLMLSFSCAGVPATAVPLASGRWELKVRQSKTVE